MMELQKEIKELKEQLEHQKLKVNIIESNITRIWKEMYDLITRK